MKQLRKIALIAALAFSGAPDDASAQAISNVLIPPQTIVGNLQGVHSGASAITFNQLAVALPQTGYLLSSSSSSSPILGTPGNAVVFGPFPNPSVIVDAGGPPVLSGGTPSALILTNATGLPIATGISGLGTGVASWAATPSSANLRAALTDETGAGSAVFATAPVLVNPNLGTPSALVLTNATGLPVSGISGFGTGVATALAVNVGSAGAPVVNGGALGTPSSGTLTSATGLPISTGLTGAGTGVLAALGINVGSAGAPVVNGGALGTPSSGVATNITALNATQLTTGTIPAARTNGHLNGEPGTGSAAAGEVGEYIESILVTGSATALTTGTAKTVTSISLTAVIGILPGSSTSTASRGPASPTRSQPIRQPRTHWTRRPVAGPSTHSPLSFPGAAHRR